MSRFIETFILKQNCERIDMKKKKSNKDNKIENEAVRQNQIRVSVKNVIFFMGSYVFCG